MLIAQDYILESVFPWHIFDLINPGLNQLVKIAQYLDMMNNIKKQ
jgi:hypothetical protein